MAANTNPIFTKNANVDWGTPSVTANTALDGTGTVTTIFTAGAEGSFVEKIRIKALGTNIATLIRIFLNNGSSNATPANNSLIKEITLPASTASNVNSLMEFDVEINLAIDAGFKLNAVHATTVASGYQLTTFGGDF